MWGGTFSGPVGVFREESKNSLESGKLVLLPDICLNRNTIAIYMEDPFRIIHED